MSRSTSASALSSETPDQLEIDGLAAMFKNLNVSLSSYCLSLQIESYYNYKSTNTIPPVTSTYIHEAHDADSTNTSSLTFFNVTGTETITPQYSPTVSPPCCGLCYIEADEAHAVYWPSPAPQPNVSTIVGAHGFTL